MYSRRHNRVLPDQVSPFGNPRIKACLAAPRGLSQLTTSFIAVCHQGIHRLPCVSCPRGIKMPETRWRVVSYSLSYVFSCQRTAPTQLGAEGKVNVTGLRVVSRGKTSLLDVNSRILILNGKTSICILNGEAMNKLLKTPFWNAVIQSDYIEKEIEKKLQTAQM